MCSDIAVSVKNLSKTYRIFAHPGDRIKQALTFGKVNFHKEFTALQEISFDVIKGESIGIIGRNGSGKSTLLQLICGILKPTSGNVSVSGRISALLELGSGFNPEFTGRENVYFQGAIMGAPIHEVNARFDEIAAFADIGEFIDQPVRTYSSGMFVRLAFSVAVHFEPELLIVDEALAVGDEAFQRKCFAKLAKFRDSGKTLFLVSHSANVIATVCKRAILLDRSRIIADGSPAIVLAQYQKLLNIPREERNATKNLSQTENETDLPSGRYPVAYPSTGALIDCPQLFDQQGMSIHTLRRGERYIFKYKVRFHTTAHQVRYTMMLKTIIGFELGGLTSHLPGQAIPEIVENDSALAEIEFTCRLLPGTYFLNAGVLGDVGNGEQFLHRVIDITSFNVEEVGPSFQGGVVDFS